MQSHTTVTRHRDVKSDNFLITADWNLKVALLLLLLLLMLLLLLLLLLLMLLLLLLLMLLLLLPLNHSCRSATSGLHACALLQVTCRR